MLDAIGLVIGIVGIIQNIKKKKSQGEQIADIRKVLLDSESILRILEEAKNVHDSFESFEKTGLKHLRDSLRRPDVTIADLRTAGKVAVDQAKTYLNHSQDFVVLDKSSNHPDNGLPTHIVASIRQLLHHQPQMLKARQQFDQVFADFKSMVGKGNVGDDFYRCTAVLSECVDDICMNADKTILSIVPVISHIQYELRVSVEAL